MLTGEKAEAVPFLTSRGGLGLQIPDGPKAQRLLVGQRAGHELGPVDQPRPEDRRFSAQRSLYPSHSSSEVRIVLEHDVALIQRKRTSNIWDDLLEVIY